MMQKFLFIFLFLIEITDQTKHSYDYKFKVWVNDDIVSTYGGHGNETEKRSRIEQFIKNQWIKVNDYYNHENTFQTRFNFLPYKFDYFQDYPNETNMDNIDFNIPLPEDNCDYRIIYSHSPYNHSIHSDYFNRSIRFSINPEVEWNQTIWDQYSTRILAHELGHSRGAYDLYAVNVNGNKNEVFYGISYNYPIKSVMNYLYDLNTKFDNYSTYIINHYAGRIVTPKMSSDMFCSLFPVEFGVLVKDMFNNPIENATVKFYGVRWLQESVSKNEQFERKTDKDGKVTFYGNDTKNNPYERIGPTSLSTYSNFLVVVYYEDNGFYNWLPVFSVQTTKIQNKTGYYTEFQFNIKPKLEFLYPLDNVLNVSLPQLYNSVDLTCQLQYCLTIKMNVSVNVWDIDGNITKVEFYSNNQLLSQVSTIPYSFEWFITTNGTYHMMVKAYDNLNGINQSKAIIINVIDDDSGVDTVMNDECLV